MIMNNSETTSLIKVGGQIEVQGAFLVSAVQTLAEMKKLGEGVLAEHGIEEIDSNAFYPSSLRRAIHSAIFERFGTSGIYWIGLETPSKFLIAKTSVKHVLDQKIEHTHELIERASTKTDIGDGFKALIGEILGHLNAIVKGSIRGAPEDFGWAIKKNSSACNYTFRIHNFSVSKREHEAFNRARLHFLLRKHTPQKWDFSLLFIEDDSTDHDGYSCCAFDLNFKPMPVDLTHDGLLQKERWDARDNLLKRALDHSLAQEERASQALSVLAASHHQTMESIRYAAILQKNQLPRVERWDGRVSGHGEIWAPRDVIGGDIWWLGKPRSDFISALSLIDCTGHGVPGAMLAVLVSNSLERLHLADPYLSPMDALTGLQAALAQSFGNSGNYMEIDNGCEIIYMNINFERHLLEIAMSGIGAILYRRESNRVERIQAPKGGLTANSQSLTQVIISQILFQKGDRLLIATDGITDQIGGVGIPRSFGFRRLQEAYLETMSLSAKQATEVIYGKFENWQGNNMRRDDTTLICVDL
jgi:serine phosphatase RsbU (regulator of sigma subunit)